MIWARFICYIIAVLATIALARIIPDPSISITLVLAITVGGFMVWSLPRKQARCREVLDEIRRQDAMAGPDLDRPPVPEGSTKPELGD